MISLRIAICDNDFELSGELETYLLDFKQCNISCEVFNKGEKLIEHLQEEKFDVFLLNIDMPNINGITLAKLIRTIDVRAFIIFLTSHPNYLSDAFRYQTFDYLLKPVPKKRIYGVLKKIVKILDGEDDKFTFMSGGLIHSISKDHILYFEKNARYAILHTVNGDIYKINTSSKKLLSKLSSQFLRIHTSYIINLSYFSALKFNKLYLTVSFNGVSTEHMELPISRKYQKSTKERISNYLKEIN